MTIDNILLIGSILLFLSILAGKTSYKFGVPTLVFFLAVGILAGSEGIVGIYFNNPLIAQFIGVVALNIILFSGGLDTRWESVKPVLWQGSLLSTLGVFITAGLVGLFTHWVTDFSLAEGLLLGAIVSSTDAAAVFSILRSRSIHLKGKIRSLLELESGSNDPMAYFLTITLISFVEVEDQSILFAVLQLLLQLFLGGLFGFIFGKLGKFTINKIDLDFEGLYPVLALTFSFITFSVTDTLGGNGFLAVYICAVILGNSNLVRKRSLMLFFDGFAWLMQIILFLTLGLLVFPSKVMPVIDIGLLISVFMILIARPASVFLCLAPFKMDIKTKTFISWVGLRGAVPIVFATYPMVAGVEQADLIFNIVFFITLLSVMLQGTTLSLASKWLKLKVPDNALPTKRAHAFEFADNVKTESTEIEISAGSRAIGRKVFELGLPPSTLIVMINRKGKYFVPSGATEVEDNDILQIIADNTKELDKAIKLFRY